MIFMISQAQPPTEVISGLNDTFVKPQGYGGGGGGGGGFFSPSLVKWRLPCGH